MTAHVDDEQARRAGADRSSPEAELADWLIDKVAVRALEAILEQNREVHVLEHRVQRLEQRLRELGEDPDLDT